MVSDDGASVGDFFGWRVCRCRKQVDDCAADGVGSPGSPQECGRWPLAHVGARVVALLYIVAYHVVQTCRSEENRGGAFFWHYYPVMATTWALFATLLYFVLINVFTALSWRHHLSALLASSTTENGHPRTRDGALPKMLRACSACIYMAVVFQLSIAMTYWGTFGFSKQTQEDFTKNGFAQAQSHGVVCVCVCADLFLTNVPIFAKDAWLPVIVHVAYLIVNVTYTLSTGSPIYDLLTWKRAESAAVVAGSLVVDILCIVFVHFFDRWRQSGRKIS
eukprot:GEMP01041587.1.p1 GENE.GEMP01041587.1~~GEMP01041587.1.p1  ORF type:complete len:277 (+),score=60.36 GEMP01041587.1:291-1121(+)